MTTATVRLVKVWLRCGHASIFAAPYPARGERITCGRCGKATRVERVKAQQR